MEKEMSTAGNGDFSSATNDTSSSSFFQSSSPRFLDYRTGKHDFTMYQPLELEKMIAPRSPHSELLMDLHPHQDLMDRHNTLLRHLKETTKQVQALRQENINLKMVNADLTSRLSLLLRATSDYAASFGLAGTDSSANANAKANADVDAALHGLRMMSLGGGMSVGHGWDDVAAEGDSPSPTSVMDSGRVEGIGDVMAERVSLPKSISVRSNGYLKQVPGGGSCGYVGRVNKVWHTSETCNSAQKVHVRGGKKEEQPLELEVYNQGMFKTELCNKWQETGACPYGEHCQFAHGIDELRPVLRHPRYKTEVCRMVLSGDHCPYGHRCHFRHTLNDQEKLIRSVNLRSFKDLNR